jgi:hypothetical protein
MKFLCLPKSILFITVRLIFSSSLLYFNLSYGQTFNSTNSSNVDLNGASLNNTNCTSNKSISFNVSGVGILSASSKELLEIDLRLFCRRYLNVAAYLRAPDGTCVQIASQLGVPAHYGQTDQYLDYKFRKPQNCLNKQPDYTPTGTPQQYYAEDENSRFGVFSTVGDIASVFNGVDANGTWTLYFSCTNSLYCNSLPRVVSAGLTFGQPISVPPSNPAAGASCVGAIFWDGGPLCATTDGKTDTSNRPPNSISGCSGASSGWGSDPNWISTSENNLWIAFKPKEPDVCINISGIRNVGGGSQGVQSIVVKPTNPSDLCSGNWTLANCPRDRVYPGSNGSTMSQNHCFTAIPGETYYLFIDGNAGAITEVYVTGIEGVPIILAAELISFAYECKDGSAELSWVTASESNNDYFVIDYSENGQEWMEIGRKQGSGSKKTATDYSFLLSQRISKGYFRLKQVDFDGKESRLKTIVANNCGNQKELKVVPNPSTGIIHLLNLNHFSVDMISVVDVLGNQVYSGYVNDEEVMTVDLSALPTGIYILVSNSKTGERTTQRIVIE